ncbi:hypothetical protein T4B_3642 [Trichinella pseudospiralis]|uniref:Uncharacterized protein n=1 Tax=Trichinella pseudospiralis TaxID=6337 RepID=A0A0V1G764_TRIPS|nr:hypothetical protein T4B_3642 [Trichinella pseudospiralis]KRY94931.1 hypothetical protein T4C_6524 [Trichinella pseudospiralis]
MTYINGILISYTKRRFQLLTCLVDRHNARSVKVV